MALAVSEFQLLLVQLAADLGVKVDRLLKQMDRLSQAEALAFITDAYPELARAYLAASGELSVQFYDEQPTTSTFVAQSVVLIPDERLAASGRWAMLQADPVKALTGSAQRALMDQSRQTVLENLAAEYDVPMTDLHTPGTRWARHAAPNACSFCRVMATRGDVYRGDGIVFDDQLGDYRTSVVGRSLNLTDVDRRMIASGQATVDELLARREKYAIGRRKGQTKQRTLRGTQKYGDRYHDHCHCTAVPVRPGGSYQPPAYVEQWQKDYLDAWNAVPNGTSYDNNGVLKAVLREMDKAHT